jgi:hypothetical protein
LLPLLISTRSTKARKNKEWCAHSTGTLYRLVWKVTRLNRLGRTGTVRQQG